MSEGATTVHPLPTEAPPAGRVRVCGARTRAGTPCQQTVVDPVNGRCRMHGGTSKRGVENGNYKNGRHSKYLKDLPATMRAGYSAALEDPELVRLGHELAVQEGLIAAGLRGLRDAEGATPDWAGVLVLARQITQWHRVARSRQGAPPDTRVLDGMLEQLVDLATRGKDAGRAYRRARADVLEGIGEKTRTAAAEWRRMHDLGALVTVEQALQFARALLDAAREVVTDPEQFRLLNERALHYLPPVPGTAGPVAVVNEEATVADSSPEPEPVPPG